MPLLSSSNSPVDRILSCRDCDAVVKENSDATANCSDVVAAEKNVLDAAKCLKKGAAEGGLEGVWRIIDFRIRGNEGKYWRRPWRVVNATS